MKDIFLDVLYAAGILAGSPYFLYKMATTGKYRSGLAERLGFIEGHPAADRIWVHGVSVGELLAARGLVAGLAREFGQERISVSTTTNTGLTVAKKNYPQMQVFYFPLDFSRAVARTFRRIDPRMVVLMELEVWPNFMARAEKLGVPVVVANGRITERSFANYRRFLPLVRGALRRVSLYLVQTQEYRRRLLELGVAPERVEVAGNIKFDTVSSRRDPEKASLLRREMGVAGDEVLIIGGSTHAGEETALLDAYDELKKRDPRVRLLVVPRHKERFAEVAGIMEASGHALFRRSSLAQGNLPVGGEVILGDTMGELESLYEAADVAFVGGSLVPRGGQSILEPAGKGRPVVFGPSVENFPLAAPLLLEARAATQITNAGELAAALEAYLNADAASRAGRAGRDAIISGKGATEKTLNRIIEVAKRRIET